MEIIVVITTNLRSESNSFEQFLNTIKIITEVINDSMNMIVLC
jgi:hypothetical protein